MPATLMYTLEPAALTSADTLWPGMNGPVPATLMSTTPAFPVVSLMASEVSPSSAILATPALAAVATSKRSNAAVCATMNAGVNGWPGVRLVTVTR